MAAPHDTDRERDALAASDDASGLWSTPNAFLGSSMLSNEFNHAHFVPQSTEHPSANPPPAPPHSYSSLQHMHHQASDAFDQPFGAYQPANGVTHAFDGGARYHQAGGGPDPASGNATNSNALQHEFMYPQMQQGFAPTGEIAHLHQPSTHPAHFDFGAGGMHPSPPLTPNGAPISPHRSNPSPYASISPASNHSFAAQQDFATPFDARRPSTADSGHSIHGDFGADDYPMANPQNGGGASGVVPSALHPFNQRNYMHMSQEVRNFGPRGVKPHPQAPAAFASQIPAPQAHPSNYSFNPAPGYHSEQPVHVNSHASDDAPIFPQRTGNGADIASLIR